MGYVDYLKYWEQQVGRDRMIMFVFEDFMADPVSGMKSLSTQLGIDPSFYNNFDFAKRNETVKIKNPWLHQLGLKLQPLFPSKLQSFILPFYLKINGGEKPSLDKNELAIIDAEVKPVYVKSRKMLEEYLGVPIEKWT